MRGPCCGCIIYCGSYGTNDESGTNRHAQFEVVIHKGLSLTIELIGEIVKKRVIEKEIIFISQKKLGRVCAFRYNQVVNGLHLKINCSKDSELKF